MSKLPTQSIPLITRLGLFAALACFHISATSQTNCTNLLAHPGFEKVELREGRNEIQLDVSDFRSGTYYLNIPGQNWRHIPLRFVVARW